MAFSSNPGAYDFKSGVFPPIFPKKKKKGKYSYPCLLTTKDHGDGKNFDVWFTSKGIGVVIKTYAKPLIWHCLNTWGYFDEKWFEEKKTEADRLIRTVLGAISRFLRGSFPLPLWQGEQRRRIYGRAVSQQERPCQVPGG